MSYEIDITKEETSVELILRRVRRHLCQRENVPGKYEDLEYPEFKVSENEAFENVTLDPELHFLLDYAGRIYDPRIVPGNTRFYKLKSIIMRVMRLYTTRQVELNATLMRLSNRFFDVFNNISNIFDYFRRAEVNITKRLEHAEHIVGRTLKRLDRHRERLEHAEHVLGSSLERLDNHRDRLEKTEAIDRTLDKRVTQLEDLRNRLELSLAENAALRKRLDKLVTISETVTKAPLVESVKPASVPDNMVNEIKAKIINDHLYFQYLNEDRGIEAVIKKREI